MQIVRTQRFDRSYRKAPQAIADVFEQKVPLLYRLPLRDFLQHPGFRPEKFPRRGPDIWQARVTKAWRFYFVILEGETISLEDITARPK